MPQEVKYLMIIDQEWQSWVSNSRCLPPKPAVWSSTRSQAARRIHIAATHEVCKESLKIDLILF